MNTKKQLLFFLLSSLFGGNLIGQEALTSTGGEASGTGGTVSYSIGQVAYTYQSGSNGTINQGVQQPLEFFNLNIGEVKSDFSVMLFPNPTIAELNIAISNFINSDLKYVLIDAAGKEIEIKSIDQAKFSIDMSEISRGNYFLNFVQNNAILKSYKIVKN